MNALRESIMSQAQKYSRLNITIDREEEGKGSYLSIWLFSSNELFEQLKVITSPTKDAILKRVEFLREVLSFVKFANEIIVEYDSYELLYPVEFNFQDITRNFVKRMNFVVRKKRVENNTGTGEKFTEEEKKCKTIKKNEEKIAKATSFKKELYKISSILQSKKYLLIDDSFNTFTLVFKDNSYALIKLDAIICNLLTMRFSYKDEEYETINELIDKELENFKVREFASNLINIDDVVSEHSGAINLFVIGQLEFLMSKESINAYNQLARESKESLIETIKRDVLLFKALAYGRCSVVCVAKFEEGKKAQQKCVKISYYGKEFSSVYE